MPAAIPSSCIKGGNRRMSDLVSLWEAHTKYEFETRDVDATMATMVAEPYVNHIPTMTGGVGHKALKHFYATHFIGQNPPDFAMTPVSRTVGTTSIVDEFVVSFTHTTQVDWMLPSVPPTGRRVEIPMVAIVQFQGNKLVHEHIYWDQASVLVQTGLLDPGQLPITGADQARKVMDKTLPSNTLMR
jgi:carboxymethylenebutenolidase